MKFEEPKEEWILAGIEKEKWAQRKIYECIYPLIYAVCLRYASYSEEADDILQEGFIKVFGNIQKFNLGTSFLAWSKRIFINTAIDYYRRESKKKTENIENVYHVDSKDVDVVSKLTEMEILGLVQKLSPVYRAVFNLFVIEGYTHREIAESLGISESTSRSNLVKARSKLKDFLSQL